MNMTADIAPSSRLAPFLAQATLVGAAALPVLAAATWLFWDWVAPVAAANLPVAVDPLSLGVAGRLAGFVLFMLTAAIQSYGLLGLRRTFQEAARGRVFSSRSVNGFRRFAWISLIMVFIGVVQQTLLIVILTVGGAAGQGALSIQLGSNELKAFFTALMLVFIAQVFAAGKQASDENKTFL